MEKFSVDVVHVGLTVGQKSFLMSQRKTIVKFHKGSY